MGKNKTPSSQCILILKRYTSGLIINILPTYNMKSLKGGIVARIGLQKGIKKADPKRYPFLFISNGRDERIRTSDFLHPMQALYQTELRPVIFNLK